MAAGLSNFQVFSQFAYGTATEILDQQVNLFNQSTSGAIVLATKGNVGDFSHTTSFGLIADLVGNRNAYGNSAPSVVDLTQLKETAVKIAMGTPPVRYTNTSFDWTQQSPEVAGAVFGAQFAQGQLAYMLNTALASANAALDTTEMSYDGTAGKASLESLNQAAGLFGDRRAAIQCWIMHSKSETDIYSQALANAERLFNFGNIRVLSDGHGRPLVVTDSESLVVDNSGTDNYSQIGLVTGGVLLDNNGDSRFYEDTDITSEENAIELLKAEGSFNLGLKGMSFSTTHKSPNDAKLADKANWTMSATQKKDTFGVKAITL